MSRQTKLFAFVLAASLAGAAGAQSVGYNFRTGDVWVDSQLGYVNDYGRSNRDYFVDDVVNSFGAPRYLVNELLGTRRWAPGDVYYACALAYTAHRPCADVVRSYDENKGQGWGVVAMRMGIKPGSAEFHALKGQLGKSNGRYKTHGGPKGGKPSGDRHDADEHAPGNSGRGRDDHDEGGGPGNSGDKGKGNSGGGKGKDKGHGH
jgi:hypothetical protein